MKKRTAFWVALINVNVLFVVAGILKIDSAIFSPVLLAVIGLTGIYTGFNVLDNLQRSKFFRPELKEALKDESSEQQFG
jgi:xanthosine utilization system XapX-like protein